MSQQANGGVPDPGYLAALEALNVRIQTPVDPPLFTATPSSPMTPVHWRWADLEKIVNELDQHLSLTPGGGRRTLKLSNPGLPYGTTPTFWLSIQYILPGEVATAHRHTPTAFRFVMRGGGCWTTVDGESYEMNAGDLVLTPSWTWHDHIHRGDEPMIWIDVLDISLVRSLHTTFFQNYNRDVQDIAPVRDVSFRTRGSGLLRAGRRAPQSPGAVNPLLTYPHARALEALKLAKGLPGRSPRRRNHRVCQPNRRFPRAELPRDHAADLAPWLHRSALPAYGEQGLLGDLRLGRHRDRRHPV